MPFPTTWPPPRADNVNSIRANLSGNATDDFADNAFLFEDPVSSLPRCSMGIYIANDGGDAIEFSFDGVTVHGKILPGKERTYIRRHESGISFRRVVGALTTPGFRCEAW